ncbi:MAG: hypothetical protein IJP61_09185 [Treponema sp.]|jgi:hypothetical protein|nr:hypothetical protein [Treponema sp.]
MGYKKTNRNRNYGERRKGRGEKSERHERREKKSFVSQKEIQENENAIKVFKAKIPLCECCGKQIIDVADAITSKETGNPVHFDCVLNKISEREKLGSNEKLVYIGQGKFAVLYFENIHDFRKFTIRKTIEWESQDSRSEWRIEMASLYSQIK